MAALEIRRKEMIIGKACRYRGRKSGGSVCNGEQLGAISSSGKEEGSNGQRYKRVAGSSRHSRRRVRRPGIWYGRSSQRGSSEIQSLASIILQAKESTDHVISGDVSPRRQSCYQQRRNPYRMASCEEDPHEDDVEVAPKRKIPILVYVFHDYNDDKKNKKKKEGEKKSEEKKSQKEKRTHKVLIVINLTYNLHSWRNGRLQQNNLSRSSARSAFIYWTGWTSELQLLFQACLKFARKVRGSHPKSY